MQMFLYGIKPVLLTFLAESYDDALMDSESLTDTHKSSVVPNISSILPIWKNQKHINLRFERQFITGTEFELLDININIVIKRSGSTEWRGNK